MQDEDREEQSAGRKGEDGDPDTSSYCGETAEGFFHGHLVEEFSDLVGR